jgi:hypothetical protein
VIEMLLEDVQAGDPNEVCVAYIYCDYEDAKQQTPINVVGTLLAQSLATLSGETRKEIVKTLQEKLKNGRSLQLEEACEILSQTLQKFRRAYLCIDALDECRDMHRKTLQHSLRDLLVDPTSNWQVRLFLTDRLHVEDHVRDNILDGYLGTPLSITLRANSDDIRTYISHHLNLDDYKDQCMNDVLRAEILEKIVDNSNGMLVSVCNASSLSFYTG